MLRRFWQSFQPNWPLLVVLGLYTLLVGIYSWATPPFEGPDEPQHFAYIEWLVDYNEFPPQGDDAWETPVEQEAGQPPLYYLLASLPARVIGIDNPRIEYRPNPYPIMYPIIYPDNDNRAIHYTADTSPLRGGWLALYAARVVTWIFGLLLIVAVYGLARQAVPRERAVALFAALLVATIPQVLFIGSIVSNDIPVAALSTMTLWLLAALMRKGSSSLLAAGVGLTYGLTVLSKASGMAMGLPIALALLWMGMSKWQSWKSAIKTGFVILAGFLIVAGWWFMRSWFLYGSPLGLETHDQTPWVILDPSTMSSPFSRWSTVFRSFWVFFGWGTVVPDQRFYLIFYLLVAVALVGLLLLFWRIRKTSRPRPDVTLAIFAVSFSGVLATSLVLEIWMHRVYAPYGRLIFPIIGGLALFLVIGWRAIHPKLPIVPIAITLITAVAAPFLLIRPAYALPEFLQEEDVAGKPQIHWLFGEDQQHPITELISARPLVPLIEPDALFPVELCWRAMAEPYQNYVVLVHVIGPENQLVAQRRTYPGLGHYPTQTWESGAIWCDVVHLLVEQHSVPETLVYKVEVGFYDPEKEVRLPAFSPSGDLVAATFVADVLIVNDDQGDKPLVQDGTVLALLDYQVEHEWRLAQDNPLSLTWSISEPLEEDYQVFVHLRDPENGGIVAQADGPPLSGWYPTSRWRPNTKITDRRTFFLPPELEPGTYELVVGFYNLVDGQRFGSEYFLESVEVLP